MVLYALAIIEQEEKILLSLRQNTPFFSGHYGLLGGKIEENESITHALIRELYEEIGITVIKNNLNFVHCLSFINENGTAITAFVFKVAVWQGSIINREPDKITELQWYALDALPKNVIPRHRHIIDMVQRGVLYSENGW